MGEKVRLIQTYTWKISRPINVDEKKEKNFEEAIYEDNKANNRYSF